MKAGKLVLVGLALIVVCIIFAITLLVIAPPEQVERMITLILSTEIITPALIFSFALFFYFVSKSFKWRYL